MNETEEQGVHGPDPEPNSGGAKRPPRPPRKTGTDTPDHQPLFPPNSNSNGIIITGHGKPIGEIKPLSRPDKA